VTITQANRVRPGGATAEKSRGSEYSALLREVKGAGLLDRRRGYYIAKIAVTGALLLGGWAVFVALGDSWWQLLVAGFLAFVFAQLGFIGHDAGHSQIFRTRRANYVVGLLHGNLGIGLSYGWWVTKHNRHHAHPNHEDKDPDVAIAALAFTKRQASAKQGLTRFIARHQRYLFVPLLMLEAVQLHAASIRALTQRDVRHRTWETVLLALHIVGYLTVLLLVLSPVKALVLRARRAELPDRASSVPEHAAAQPSPCAGDRQVVLPPARRVVPRDVAVPFVCAGAAPYARRRAAATRTVTGLDPPGSGSGRSRARGSVPRPRTR